jgi:hypothetical protein
MNRREVLQQVAWLMGGAVSAPAILGVLNGCTAKPSANIGWQPTLLSAPQAELVTVVADLIIPRTDTPGAVDVGVPAFIDTMLKDVYAQDDRERYLSGLQAFDAAAQSEHGKPFVKLDETQRLALLRKFHDEAAAAERATDPRSESYNRPFVLMTKELTLLGFFTSQIGATKVLQYEAVPGRYQACIPISQAGNGKNWAVETSLVF